MLVYCRSGNRSKTAADALVGLGYFQEYEFGSICDWPLDFPMICEERLKRLRMGGCFSQFQIMQCIP